MNPQAMNEIGKLRQKELHKTVRRNQVSKKQVKNGRGPSVIGEILGIRKSD